VVIRLATADDAATILSLIRDLATFEREPDAVEVTAEQLRLQLAAPRPPFECLIAEVRGAPAGFALYYSTYSTWRGLPGIFLEDLFVKPEVRRRGVARALLRRLAAIVVERGWGRLEWNVLDWNSSAIDFYETLGAHALRQWVPFRIDKDALEQLAGE
jgi:GNAT superfamily N-acetyltransferase